MQVNSISFFEHDVLEGGGETSGRSDAAAAERLRRQCVMEAEVTNRTDGPLQVFICAHFCLLSILAPQVSLPVAPPKQHRCIHVDVCCPLCFLVGQSSVKACQDLHNIQYTIRCNIQHTTQYALYSTIYNVPNNIQ